MNLHTLLLQHHSTGKTIRVGLIGAGKFGSMFLAQIPTMIGVDLVAIADLDPERAHQSCRHTGWDEVRLMQTRFFDSGAAMIAAMRPDVVIEATGHPAAGIAHALAAISAGSHIVMVNVEADVLAGASLAAKARRAGLVYSMAYGDQPALVCEMVDWARATGFQVVAAGKGTKYLPCFHASTPATVWGHYGLSEDEARAAGMNPQMFNSFLDGTKSAIEMAAIANGTGLFAPEDGLSFPPCGVDDLPHVLRPFAEGGCLAQKGMVEVVSSLERDGRPVFRDLRWGVYVVIEAPTPYTSACFRQYGLKTDASGRYAAMYKPYHLIGLELGISVLSAALRREPTGQSQSFAADCVAVAKRDLNLGEMLDGEGGYTVWGKCITAKRSLALKALPIGLAHGLALIRPVANGSIITENDVTLDETRLDVKTRREHTALVF